MVRPFATAGVTMPIVYLGLGSNLGDRLGNLRQAVAELSELAELQAC